MLPLRLALKFALFFLLCDSPWLRAQELTFLGGNMKTANLGSSYSWQIDYRQNFYENFAGSFAYINEGHVPGHHRDGDALQVWGCLPFFDGKITVSLGEGVYYFYDTQVAPLGGSADVHGTAPIYSLAVTGYFSNRWFCRLMFNRISPS